MNADMQAETDSFATLKAEFPGRLNSVHSAGIVQAENLTEENGYELIEGEIK